MSKHTRGPWSRDKYGQIFDAAGSEVLFRGVSILSSGSEERILMAEANTQLIAAAPELLKACQQALYALKGREHDGFLRDAIAKAEGVCV